MMSTPELKMSIPSNVCHTLQSNDIEYILPTGEDLEDNLFNADYDEHEQIDYNTMTISEKSKRKENALKRMRGQKYMGFTKINGILVQAVPKPQRKIGPPCSSPACLRSRLRHCQSFDEATRRDLFKEFWSMTWKVKRVFINDYVSKVPKKRITVENSKKQHSFRFTLPYNDESLQVCRSMFQSTLGLCNDMVRKWL